MLIRKDSTKEDIINNVGPIPQPDIVLKILTKVLTKMLARVVGNLLSGGKSPRHS